MYCSSCSFFAASLPQEIPLCANLHMIELVGQVHMKVYILLCVFAYMMVYVGVN